MTKLSEAEMHDLTKWLDSFNPRRITIAAMIDELLALRVENERLKAQTLAAEEESDEQFRAKRRVQTAFDMLFFSGQETLAHTQTNVLELEAKLQAREE